MTADELKEIIGAIVEEKLIELLGDPDEGLVTTKTLLVNNLSPAADPLGLRENE